MSLQAENGHPGPQQPTTDCQGGHDAGEATMRWICAATLGRPTSKVKMHRSFVAQGGDSLLAIKLMARCREGGYNITIHDILQAKNITELCQRLSPISTISTEVMGHGGANGHASSTPEHVTSDIVRSRLEAIMPNPSFEVEALFPCSPVQEVFLAAHGMRPDMYQCTAIIDITPEGTGGTLDYQRLAGAWNSVVRRHPALRTVFIESDGRPGAFDQVVLKNAVSPVQDFGSVSETAAADAAARRPVRFEPGSPLAATLLSRGPRSARLRLDMSHALVDGESVSVLLHDLSAAYAGDDAAAPVMSYADYVSYQKRLSPDDSVIYWESYLKGAQPSLFPPSNDQAGRQDLGTERFRLELAPGSLREFCATHNVTAANVCQVAWALLLRSYTGSNDVCFSYVSSGRQAPLSGIEGAVGAFVDTMVCRVDTSSASSLAQTLTKASEDFMACLSHPCILAMNHQERGEGLSRLRGNSIMSCLGKPSGWGGATPGTGLSFGIYDAVNPSEYDISLNVEISQDTFEVGIDFWESRVTKETARSVADSLKTAIANIIGHAARLGDVDIVPPAHVERIREWNKTIPPRLESRIQDRVEENQRLRPDALAIQGWDGSLTYRELNDLADKLAAHLVSVGVGPETKVPLCFEKSKWAIISQLAIMKASGCVVPLSPNQPRKRTELILQDIAASVVLTSPKHQDRFADLLPSILVVVDDHLMSQLPGSSRPACQATPDDAAFIIYTSGSTGVPKGVVLPHASLCTSLDHLGAKFELGPHTRMVQFSAYTFDIAIQDIYTTLHYGGCLCIISDGDRLDNLGPSMNAYGVTCAGLTSSVAGTLSPDEVPSLETLVLLGEAVKPVVASRWIPHVAVYNAYGPSECSMQASCRRLTPTCNALNIGHALAGVLWVVDPTDYNRLVPIGSPGELLIEGPLQARGYLNNEAKTDEAFVRDPAWVSRYGFGSGRRFYRTGDLVRQCTDGSVLYMGRRDAQVKFRGMRLEVGEIEHHLIQHHSTADAAVVLPSDGPCRDRLVAIIHLRKGDSQTPSRSTIAPLSGDHFVEARSEISLIKEHLAGQLPENIVPTVWIPLSGGLPQNESAKLDRKALSQWVETMDIPLFETLMAVAKEHGRMEPANDLERHVRDAWAAVLRLPADQVPLEGRSFLGLGGDSIGAMRVVSRAWEHGISLAVRDILQSKSLSELAQRSSPGHKATNGHRKMEPEGTPNVFKLLGLTDEGLGALHDTISSKLAVQPEDIEDVYPCSPIQHGILVSQAKSPSEYQIQQIFRVECSNSKGVSVDGIVRAWQSVVDRHPILRSVFAPSLLGEDDGTFYQIVLRTANTRVEHLRCEDADVESHLGVEADPDLGILTAQPGHRLTVYSTTAGRVYCRHTLNHALVDASSLVLIQKDLVDAYDGRLTPGPGPSYSAYISYLQRFPAGESLGHWSTRLAGAEPCHLPALTKDGLLPETRSPARGEKRQPMEMAVAEFGEVEGLQRFSETHGVTVANIFQLAWALVLSKFTGSTDVSFGYLANGRDVDVEGVNSMVGPLINILVTRVALSPKAGIKQALRQVQDDFLDGFGHQRASLLDIWHALGLKGQGLFNTSLSYRHAAEPAVDDTTLSLEMVAVEDPTEYDATVSVVAVPGEKITVWLQHAPDYICREAAAGLVCCLLQVVKSFMEHPEGLLEDVQMATSEDVCQIRMWNDEVPGQSADETIHGIVSSQRRLRPREIAVCAWDDDLSYEELEDAAESLARYLVADLQVGVESKVALCFDKSRWAVVAQLAVLKSGGTVVSINPKHPLQRLEVILKGIGADVMLTTGEHAARYADLIPHIVEVGPDAVLEPTRQATTLCSLPVTKPENAAFIIYTSGSTGTPKGVILTHSSLVSSFKAHGKAYGMGPDTRNIQFASYTFDASISDIWATICHGGCVCVISEDERMNDLEGAIRSYGGTLSQLTPTVASLLELSKVPSIRTLVLGGEPVRASLIEQLVKAPAVAALNGYGPSECSIYTTCGAPLRDVRQAPVIGRPLVGSVWVVDEAGNRVCPVGAVGELWIGGPLLARGYLNDERKTEGAFVRDPEWARRIGLSGRRFYRTGDLVRQSHSGGFVFVSRKDTQVKIRGQRIEMGEIEYQVKKAFPGARGVVASLIRPSGGRDRTVVAVVLELWGGLRGGASYNASESPVLDVSNDLGPKLSQLRSSLSDSLPSYMVPALYVPVSQLPLTTSGKVDRRRLSRVLHELPAANLAQYSLSETQREAPVTETEKALQSLWAAVLGVPVDEIGIQDHFLHSGGDSFTAMRLVGKATSSGVSLGVADVFSHPKLVDMARAIDQQQGLLHSGAEDDIAPFALWVAAGDGGDENNAGCSKTYDLGDVARECAVSVDDVEDVYPCTPLQEGLMAITAQAPRAYIGSWAYRIPQGVDLARYKDSWRKLVATAPILRTRIVPGRGSGALQVVIREEAAWDSGTDLKRHLRDSSEMPMAYGSRLSRLAVIEPAASAGERFFVLTAHHSLYDGLSLVKMFETASRLYSSEEIPATPPYTRFIRHLQQRDASAEEAFWRAQLLAEDDHSRVFPEPPSPSYQPQPSLVARRTLHVGAPAGHITSATLLRAAWALAVAPHSGSAVLFATTLSGRAAPIPGILDILAPTITTVPLRIPVENSQGVREYLDMVHRQSVDMMPFEHTGLQNIKRLVGGGVEPRHLLVVQPAAESEIHVGERPMGLELVDASMEGFYSYALTVECVTSGEAVEVEARYDERVLSTPQVRRLLGRFDHMLGQLRTFVDGESGVEERRDAACLGDIEFVSPDELAQLVRWNEGVPAAQEVVIHDLVRKNSIAQPEAPAVCSWDGALSYGRLDSLSDALAHRLVSLGVGPEVAVLVCLDKSKWAPVVQLAILKAGGVVVPVSANPVQRLYGILEDTEAKVALVTPHYMERFRGKLPHILPVDGCLFESLDPAAGAIPSEARPNNTAFIVYTSGSTGTPKGVVLEHRSMATSLLCQTKKFDVGTETRGFQFADFTFDAAIHDIYAMLIRGGCVCLPSEEERVNDPAGAIRRMGVNYIDMTPAVLATIRPADAPSVQTVLVGGDALRPEQVGPWVGRVRRVVNVYGPAECCIMVAGSEVVAAGSSACIGRPLAAGLWVVDEETPSRLLPPGARGELVVEGPVLARGYLNDEERTAAVFMENPAWISRYGLGLDGTGRRVYHTGDLVVQHDDGSFLYVGRKDGQIKIRGQRVETREVMHHLAKQVAVADAIVLFPRRGPAKARLVGVLTLHDFSSGAFSAGDIRPLSSQETPAVLEQVSLVRDALAGDVPGYMVPSEWVVLEAMPHNSSGKVDRKGLVQWLELMDDESFRRHTGPDKTDTTLQEPETPLESQLQSVIAEVLRLPISKVPLGEPFLSMGGDSITAMQVVSQIRDQYGITVVVRDILQSRSIRQLALKATAGSPEVEHEEEADGVEFPLSPAQQLYFNHTAPDNLCARGENRFNQSACLAARPQVTSQDAVVALGALVKRHPMLRARFLGTDRGLRQKIESYSEGSFHLGIHEAESLAAAEDVIARAQRGLDLEKGPVFSADWIEIPRLGKKLVFLAAHRLVIDLVSWRIIHRDLESLLRSPGAEMPKSPMSFRRWTQLQAKHAEEITSPKKLPPSEPSASDWAYWGVTPEANVYGDRTGTHFSLTEDETTLLFSDNQPLRTEPVEIIIAGLLHSFRQAFPDRPPPTVFNEGHGRQAWTDAIDLSGTVGWFTTLSPISVPADIHGLVQVLSRTKDARRSMDSRGRGLDYLGARFLTGESASYSTPEIAFNYTVRFQQLEDEENVLCLDSTFEDIPRVSALGANVRRLALFEVEASVHGGMLRVDVNFNRNMRKQDGFHRWTRSYASSLRGLLSELSRTPFTFTMSDVPLLGVTYEELSRLQREVLPRAGVSDMGDMEDMYPCSPIQQGMLFSRIKDHTAYQMHNVYELTPLRSNTVDVGKLGGAWNRVVARHAILRTIFVQSVSGQSLFYQVVLRDQRLPVPQLRCDSSSDVSSTFAQACRAEYADNQSPNQMAICTTRDGRTYVRLDCNHLLIDASSLAILFRDLIQAYDGALSEAAAPSYGLLVSFLQQTPPSKSLAYWTSRLEDARPCHLPASTSPTAKTRSLRRLEVEVEPGDIQGLYAFRDDHGVTVANIVQLAWGLVLSRYTGSKDILFGYVTNGRDAPIEGVGEIVGPMINMTVSRINLSAATISEAAVRIQKDAVEALENQRTSLGDIHHALHLSDRGLFNTMLSCTREAADTLPENAGLGVQSVYGEDPTEYDVNVTAVAGEGTMKLFLQYSTSFLETESAECILDSLQHALRSVISNGGDTPLDNMDAVSPADIDRIRRWTAVVPPAIQGRVADKIHVQALSRPGAPAVCAWDGQLTYAELSVLAGQVARQLRILGISEGVAVGLYFEKSLWAVAAMVGVLRAGGLMVPLGFKHPAERLRLILDDTEAPVILTSPGGLGAALEVSGSRHVLVLSPKAEMFKPALSPEEVQLPVPVEPESAAALIYTSGSTGRPKGVVLTHSSLFTSLEAHGARLGFGTATRALQFVAYVFDVSLLDTLGVLQFGGCVCVVSEEDRLDTRGLATRMDSMQVNFACLTPTVAALLGPAAVPSLRRLTLVGEQLPSVVVEDWSPHVEIYNGYGPAECSIVSTINGPITDGALAANIGRPVAGVSWVVDPDCSNSLVPLGAVGELLMEGPIVSRGYLNDTEATSSSFITDPGFLATHGLGSGMGRRMYRTGDLVRQSPADGTLTYVGRRDDQVKLRGQRIELGEIEHCVKTSLPAALMVAAAVVTPGARGRVDPMLAVALTLRDHEAGNIDSTSPLTPITSSLSKTLGELRNSIAKALPSFMVPSLYVPLARMQMTVSGKLDRLSLRVLLESLGEEQLSQYSLSEAISNEELTDTGRVLLGIWTEALRGDSVTAMRLVALARDLRPPLPVDIADVFQHPVLADMATVIDSKAATSDVTATTGNATPGPFSSWPAAAPSAQDLETLASQCNLEPDDICDAYPCTPLQEGMFAATARQAGAYVNRLVFRLDESVKTESLKSAWRQIFDLVPTMGSRVVDNAALGPVNVETREPLHFPTISSDLDAFLERDSASPMGFGTRLMRLAIVGGGTGRFFVWTAHHSVFDGWTLSKLFDAVSRAYSGRGIPKFAPFPRLVRHIQAVKSAPEAKQYWSAELKGHRTTSFPDVSRLRQTHTPVYHNLSRGVTMPDAPAKFTLATLLRAAWSLVLSAETGTRDVSFAMPMSGRTAPVEGILDIMGPAITTVPVRVQVEYSQSVAEFLGAIQQQSVDMIPFEHMGLQHIRRAATDATLDFNHLFLIQPSAENLSHSEEILPGHTLVPQDGFGLQDYLQDYPLLLTCNTNSASGMVREIELHARFDQEVLSQRKVEAVLEQFSHVLSQLHQATSSPDDTHAARVGDLDLISPLDIQQLGAWNDHCPPPQLDACLHELVHEQAAKHPGAAAVSSWDGGFTYSELDNVASRLAHHLCGLGIGQETAVGLMFEKTKWAVVAEYAILKAGGTVVPLNHKNPRHRIEGILEITHASILLASQHFDHCQDLAGCQTLTVDQALLDELPDVHGSICNTVRPENASFIIFTSGSTGTPKGVVLEHGSVARILLELGALCGLDSATRLLQFSAYTFDISFAEIFATLFRGGCVCLVSEDERMGDLAGAMEAARVNTAWLTPTVARLLSPRDVPTVRSMAFAGEVLKVEVLGAWIDAGVELFNAYGPAECTAVTTVRGPIRSTEDASNLGRAIGGSNLWVVDPDDYHRLVPVGSVGELLVDGSVLSREYLGDPGKTADSFVVCPAWAARFQDGPGPGRRLYRTGDLVRQTGDGTLEYVGRRDTQIKVHGQRIETGEIEYWIKSKLAGARDVAVGMLTTERGDVLAAAVETGSSQGSPGEDTVRVPLLPMSDSRRRAFRGIQERLGDVLPAYMVPRLYLPVSKLPLSPSGKLDRKAVWEALQQSSLLSSYLLVDEVKLVPCTETEQQLQSLWAESLSLPAEEVGANDDFFALGGDSILAMRMVAKARRDSSVAVLQRLTVTHLFRHRILSVIAGILDEQHSTGDGAVSTEQYEPFSAFRGPPTQSVQQLLTPLLASPGVIVDAAQTTDFQALSVIASLQASRDLMAHITLDAAGPCDVSRWRESCLRLIQCHEILRTAYVVRGEKLLQVVLREYRPGVPHYEAKGETIEEVTRALIAQDMHRPPQYGRPFAEFAIITSSAGSRHRILFRLSHADYDAIAVSYFLGSLRSIHDGGPVAEHPGFCRYVASIATPDRADSHLYWQNLLRGSAMPQLCRQGDAPARRDPPLVHFASFETKLGDALRHGTTPSAIIRAAWARVLAVHTGTRDVVFGEVVSGRNTGSPVAEGASGCCANLVPVRVPFDDKWTARDLLEYLREQQISRLPHETLGFREILRGLEDLDRARPFTSRINHLDAPPRAALDVGGIEYGFSMWLTEGATDYSDVSVTSFSTPDSIRVSMGYLEGYISSDEAGGLLESLRESVELFLREPRSAVLG